MNRLPIRLRLTIVFAAVMAVVLCATGAYGYFRLSDGLKADLDRELQQRVQDISGPLARPGNTLSDLAGSGFIEHGESFAELLTATGQVVESTATLRGRPLLSPAEARRAAQSPTFVNLPSAPGLNEPARVLAAPIRVQRRQLVLLAGATRENGAETLSAVRSRLLIAGPLLLIVSSLMAYGLAAAALRPVERMRRQAARLTAGGSAMRLPLPPAQDEIARLGGTLNDLLSNVELSVAREHRFIANASHELRTPLALLRTELDLATRRPRSRAELQTTIASASVEVDRLVSLANDLLILARESPSGLPISRADISVPELLQRCADRFPTDEHPRAVVVDPRAAGTVCADEARISQALDNLIDNALTHGGGTVELTSVDRVDAVEMHVLDQGNGFEHEMLDRAFDRFSHGKSSRGAGLGLALVAAIAAAHGGRVGLRNRDGGGADSWISVPKRFGPGC